VIVVIPRRVLIIGRVSLSPPDFTLSSTPGAESRVAFCPRARQFALPEIGATTPAWLDGGSSFDKRNRTTGSVIAKDSLAQ
jgi:hypothetical protein